jgi:hypothetical protein
MAAAVLVMVVTTASPARRLFVLGGALALMLVPFGYSNLLIAFQSQFTFFLLASVGALALWRSETMNAWRCIVGATIAFLALFTVGAGILVGLTLAMVAFWRWRLDRSRLWLSAMAAAALVVAIGVALHVSSGAVSPAAVLPALGRYLAWPAGNFVTLVSEWPDSARYFPGFALAWPSPEAPWLPAGAAFLNRHPSVVTATHWTLGLCLQAPGLALLGRNLSRRVRPDIVTGLVLWSLLNIAAMALARSDYELVPPRFQDILAVGLLANGCALQALLYPREAAAATPRLRLKIRTGLAAGWTLLAIGCVAITAWGIFRVQLPRKRDENRAAAALIQRYLVEHDAGIFQNQPPNYVPWPGYENLLPAVLDDADVRGFLPRGLLPTAQRPPAPPASAIAAILRERGAIVALAGLILTGFAARMGPRPRPQFSPAG